MASHPPPPINEHPSLLLTEPGKRSPGSLPPLWSQLNPLCQQQIAQHLARLIQTFRLQTSGTEVEAHE